MANYESVTRSNYFHVKDEDAFSKFMPLQMREQKKSTASICVTLIPNCTL